MQPKPNIDLFGASALTLFSLVLGLNQVVIKVSAGGFSPVFMAGLRSVGAAVIVLIWMKWRKLDHSIPPGAAIWGITLGLLFGAEFLCIFIALDITTVSRVSVLFYTMPVWLSLAAHVLIPSERIHGIKAAGLVMAVAGVALALADRGNGGNAPSLLGDVLALAAALGWTGIALIVKMTPMGKAKPETQLLWQLMVSAPMLLIAAMFFGPFIRELEPLHLAGLAFQIVAVASFGFLAWFWLLTIYPASGVASFSFLAPVFSVILGWLLLDEHINFQVWAALGLVATGIILINRPARA